MSKKVHEFEKVNAIFEEVVASFEFITIGLKILKEQTSIASNNHVSLQLLSSEFERVLKIALLVKDKYLTGKFPELQKAKKQFEKYDRGHGIKKMLDELIEYSNTSDLMQRTPIVEDIEFIKTNQRF